MNNPILQSERFESAARSLVSAFEESVAAFGRSVEKMVRIAGMQAENDQRKHRGESMAYSEQDFQNA